MTGGASSFSGDAAKMGRLPRGANGRAVRYRLGMGHNAGWTTLLARSPVDIASVLDRVAQEVGRGALLGHAAEDARRALAAGGSVIAILPSEHGAAVYDTFDDGYMPDLVLARALAFALDGPALVTWVSDASNAMGEGVLGPAARLRGAFPRGTPPWAIGEGALRSAQDIDTFEAAGAVLFAFAAGVRAARHHADEWGETFSAHGDDRILLEHDDGTDGRWDDEKGEWRDELGDDEPGDDELHDVASEADESRSTGAHARQAALDAAGLGAVSELVERLSSLTPVGRWSLEQGVMRSAPRVLFVAHAPAERGLILTVDAANLREARAWDNVFEEVVRHVDAAILRARSDEVGPLVVAKHTVVLTPHPSLAPAREVVFVGPPGLRRKLDVRSILELVARARGTDGVALHPADAPRAARSLT